MEYLLATMPGCFCTVITLLFNFKDQMKLLLVTARLITQSILCFGNSLSKILFCVDCKWWVIENIRVFILTHF